jgi:NAD(P)-dependent dehydrogenase (short-subunit alcohol dehydrogenase family)
VSEPITVVTGASSGIGTETARVLAQRGHHVAIVCRNPAKGEATLGELTAAAPDATIDLFRADLSELAQVRQLADDLHAKYDHIDVLINNAGVNLSQSEHTSEGFDVMMATNYLAPVLLTHLVGDLLLAGPQGRVVNVASEAHRFAAGIDFDELPSLGNYRGGLLANRAYGLTKLLLVLHTQELARRLEGTAVTANSLCPGLVATNLVGAQAMVTRLGDVLSRTPLVRTPRQGAQMSIKLASDPAMSGVSGKFFTSTTAARVLPPVGARGDLELQRDLWDRTEQWIGR